YAVTFYVIIGMNVQYIFDFTSVWNIYVILFIMKFGLGTLLYIFFKDKLVVLFGTLKNGGAAIAFAILMFGVEATVPFAINGITTPLYILYLEWLLGK